ncbi:virulence-associated E family protein [Listeria ilorinensis]|uniref:virulence-associated E family protein n=1 Tax=Listeria ilorinensis TaxID=2867439 RepID=UPI001EF4F24F|nr:virulence-associated E family protein [Listeria ilorinensis]
MEAPEIKVKINQELNIATGTSRVTKRWKNDTLSWSDFLNRLARPTRTQEAVAQYQKLPKSEKGQIKDVGGFVGGFLKQGRRQPDAVVSRSLLTLDADSITDDIWETFGMFFDCAAAIYSTHSHTPEKPRLRLIVPVSRPVSAEEYQPLARKLASKIGMDNFDDTTYQPERLMFWPSVAADGEYVFDYQDGAFLDPDELLSEYVDWTDSTAWPESSRSHGIRDRQAKKQGDPLEKKGIIGAFCRAYDIREAIETFLQDVYEPTGKEDRYTYLEGSTVSGLVLYDDKFAYSHHGTDPVGDKLCNAFDLVRIHKFADQDEDAKDGTPVNKLPSFKAMKEFILEDGRTKSLMVEERLADAAEDFENLQEVEDKSWMKLLEFDERGQIEASAKNLEIIFSNDPNLHGKVAFDLFAQRLVLRDKLPWARVGEHPFWKDSDDAGLRVYIEKVYGISHKGKIDDAFIQEVEKHAFHPVRDYLDPLEWDGVKRVETLLIDYLGAEDTTYNRIVTRKALCGAVARIYVPGIKFDYMLTVTGPQGVGKSSVPAVLAGKWFSDTLDTVTGKDAYEALQGVWIMEMGEMTATKKADIEATKHFITKKEDAFRVAYGRHKSYFPRQCIFWGTSNDQEFLRDRTGNRRFWPVEVGLQERKYRIWDMTEETRAQIWAEAKALWNAGEKLYLTDEEEELAKEQQDLHTEDNPLEGLIREYLEIRLPKDWYDRSIFERRSFIKAQGGEMSEEGTTVREKVCALEIWCELMDGDPKNFAPVKSKEIHSIMQHMDGWRKPNSRSGKLRFGTGYGIQKAYVKNLI